MKSCFISSISLMALTGMSPVTAGGGKKLGLCQVDCDKDIQCKGNLLCADAHKKELKAAGFDKRKANCGPGKPSQKNLEVCFDPKILKKKGYGGGGMYLSVMTTITLMYEIQRKKCYRSLKPSLTPCSILFLPRSAL